MENFPRISSVGQQGKIMTEILKIFAWPLAVLCAIVFVCIFFRAQWQALLNRTTSVGKDGLKASAPTGQSVQKIEKPGDQQDLVEKLFSPVLRQRENLIRKELKESGPKEDSETIKVLIKYLAANIIALNCEFVYRNIFGSQIFLLKQANENRGTGLHVTFVTQHFQHVQKMFAPSFDQWTVDTYTHFLLNSQLLFRDADYFKLTDQGVAFLEWLTRSGSPEKKPL